MLVYRIGKTKYAKDISGEGARLNGGRWNNIGTPCIYSSGSKSLALLEYTVNVGIEDVPRALSFTTFNIPEENILFLMIEELPGNWQHSPAPASTRELGTKLLENGKHLVYAVPSVVINDEWNYLFNPLHRDSSNIKIVNVEDFVYDVRLKTI